MLETCLWICKQLWMYSHTCMCVCERSFKSKHVCKMFISICIPHTTSVIQKRIFLHSERTWRKSAKKCVCCTSTLYSCIYLLVIACKARLKKLLPLLFSFLFLLAVCNTMTLNLCMPACLCVNEKTKKNTETKKFKNNSSDSALQTTWNVCKIPVNRKPWRCFFFSLVWFQ